MARVSGRFASPTTSRAACVSSASKPGPQKRHLDRSQAICTGRRRRTPNDRTEREGSVVAGWRGSPAFVRTVGRSKSRARPRTLACRVQTSVSSFRSRRWCVPAPLRVRLVRVKVRRQVDGADQLAGFGRSDLARYARSGHLDVGRAKMLTRALDGGSLRTASFKTRCYSLGPTPCGKEFNDDCLHLPVLTVDGYDGQLMLPPRSTDRDDCGAITGRGPLGSGTRRREAYSAGPSRDPRCLVQRTGRHSVFRG
jgi:hypothetical protein